MLLEKKPRVYAIQAMPAKWVRGEGSESAGMRIYPSNNLNPLSLALTVQTGAGWIEQPGADQDDDRMGDDDGDMRAVVRGALRPGSVCPLRLRHGRFILNLFLVVWPCTAW